MPSPRENGGIFRKGTVNEWNLSTSGNGNYVARSRIITVASPESLPVRRLVQDAKSVNRVIDVSCGKKTKSVILTDSEHASSPRWRRTRWQKR